MLAQARLVVERAACRTDTMPPHSLYSSPLVSVDRGERIGGKSGVGGQRPAWSACYPWPAAAARDRMAPVGQLVAPGTAIGQTFRV